MAKGPIEISKVIITWQKNMIGGASGKREGGKALSFTFHQTFRDHSTSTETKC